MKKVFSFFLALLMACSMSATCIASDKISEGERLNNEVEANEQYQKLLEALSINEAANDGNGVSSDFYGGAYINDFGNLVVCVTDDYDPSSNTIEAYTGNDDIAIESVAYSFNTLLQEQEKITELYENLKDMKSNNSTLAENGITDRSQVQDLLDAIRSTYIDEENNCLVIEIENLTDEKIEIFQKIFSVKDFIEFEEGYTVTTTAGWYPGKEIFTEKGRLSTGYPVYFTNGTGQRDRGFITAGHSYEPGDLVYKDGEGKGVLGVCVDSKFSGNTDAALIQITVSNYDISDITYYSGTTLNTDIISLPSQGTTIYKEGAASKKTDGKVESTSAVVFYDDATITDVYKTSVENIPGDSGGVAYSTTGAIVGSMSGSTFNGKDKTLETFVCSYICKARNAMDALDCVIWN